MGFTIGIPLCWSLGLPYLACIVVSLVAAVGIFFATMPLWEHSAASELRRSFKRVYDPDEFERCEVEFDDGRLHAKTRYAETKFAPDFVTDTAEDDLRYYLFCQHGNMIAIPKRQIVEGDADAFVAELRRAVAAAKNESNDD